MEPIEILAVNGYGKGDCRHNGDGYGYGLVYDKGNSFYPDWGNGQGQETGGAGYGANCLFIDGDGWGDGVGNYSDG